MIRKLLLWSIVTVCKPFLYVAGAIYGKWLYKTMTPRAHGEAIMKIQRRMDSGWFSDFPERDMLRDVKEAKTEDEKTRHHC
jgi:hypothetical protein